MTWKTIDSQTSMVDFANLRLRVVSVSKIAKPKPVTKGSKFVGQTATCLFCKSSMLRDITKEDDTALRLQCFACGTEYLLEDENEPDI